MKVDIFVRINELNDDGTRKLYDVYNDFTFNNKTDIEDYNLLVRDICEAVNRGEIRKKLKEIGEGSLEE